MKSFGLTLILILALAVINVPAAIANAPISGQQPNLAVDSKGTIRMAYGAGEKIYCASSTDNGNTFLKPVLVATLPGMQLGHSRGPQIASSTRFSMITAMDKEGNITSYKLDHTKGIWTKTGTLNDVPRSAPEGLMALTADKENNFYATWLDVRLADKNNIFFSSFDAKLQNWTKNTLVYQSPDEHVCECCKPNIAFNGNKLVISFRNWLLGSRDIYYTSSSNKGKTFTKPLKSGNGTWKLDGCPMDGGGLSISDKGLISAAWQRNGDIYYWTENQTEKKVATGRGVTMTQNSDNPMIAWQEKGNVMVMNLNKNTSKEIGKGSSIRLYTLNNAKLLCVWEDDKNIHYLTL
ncbi:hypothetical protein [Pedobacter foliorum]|uniref:hypothetical protein n=1 Tax=Pedobacter foliorum TaxID=2739058 RepID=UPI0015669BB3|nr:hypothetical protein [Pedobacter foliorum]NRF40104.1 hypothetical protein [Pedobacter foliorum]